ncbi:MAG TPA: hypothetical protein VFC01_13055 [Mycobacterium sp.]|nr:hypothetical protein [Mycobacterium sp.]
MTGVQRHDSAVMDRHVLLDDALTAAPPARRRTHAAADEAERHRAHVVTPPTAGSSGRCGGLAKVQ